MTAAARFAPDSHRRSLVAKVHIARKELGLDEDTYRSVIAKAAQGKESAADCSEKELVAVLDHFKARGFAPKPRAGTAGPRQRAADHPSARKARALWISLYHLGAVRNSSEQALEAFATRQLGCQHMQWMRQSDCFRLIEALKAMADRNGWTQRGPAGEVLTVEQLQEGLCRAILAKLKAVGVAPQAMPFDIAIGTFGNMPLGRRAYGQNEYARIATAFGEWLRKAGHQGEQG